MTAFRSCVQLREAEPLFAAVRLYLVAPRSFDIANLESLVEAGVGMLQLREKSAWIPEVAAAWREEANRCGIPFALNDSIDGALASGADAVHLGQNDASPHDAKKEGLLVGRSTRTNAQVDEAVAMYEEGVIDYFAVGPVFATPTKPGREAVGFDLLRYASSQRTRAPWFAIGGINSSNCAEVLAAGATRICVVRAIVDAPDPAPATAELWNLVVRAAPDA